MALNFAFMVNPMEQSPLCQQITLGTLQMVKVLTASVDGSEGRLYEAVAKGIDPRPGTPSISEKTTAFAINRYFSADVPGAKNTTAKQGLVIEILLDQQYYAVFSLEEARRGGGNPGEDWPPFAVQKVTAPKNLSKILAEPSPAPGPVKLLAQVPPGLASAASPSPPNTDGYMPISQLGYAPSSGPSGGPGGSGYVVPAAAGNYGVKIPVGNGNYGTPLLRPVT